MATFVSIIVPTHSPPLNRLHRTLVALAKQNYPRESWELLLVDNASPEPVSEQLATIAHPAARVVREPRLGLTHARLAGIRAARGDVLIFADDDNLLRADYLAESVRFIAEHPDVAVVGGRIAAEFETPPAPWSTDFHWSLAIKNYGDVILISNFSPGDPARSWPFFTPVGAGMVLRAEAARRYADYGDKVGLAWGDRRGNSLSSGGDCELVMQAALLAGAQVAYNPALNLVHLIPAWRLRFSYLARLNFQGGMSWGRFLVVYGFHQPISRLSLFLRLPWVFWQKAGWTRRGFIAWAAAAGEFVGRSRS